MKFKIWKKKILLEPYSNKSKSIHYILLANKNFQFIPAYILISIQAIHNKL